MPRNPPRYLRKSNGAIVRKAVSAAAGTATESDTRAIRPKDTWYGWAWDELTDSMRPSEGRLPRGTTIVTCRYTRTMRHGAAPIVVALACGFAAGRCTAATPADRPLAIQELADRILASTVGVASEADGGSFSGSGFVVSADGHVLTAASAVPRNATGVEVLLPGCRRLPAEVVEADGSIGVALVKVATAEALPCLPLARACPAVGDPAFTAADVDGVMRASGRASFSRGIVSGIYEVAPQPEAPHAGRAIETTAAVNPGSDGGPLVDAGGRVVGIISLAVSSQRWQGVAIPTTTLLERFAPLASGTLNIAVDDAPPPAAPAPLAGLRQAADAIQPFLVGVDVERTWPAERLPRTSWDEHRRGLAGWEGMPDPERKRRFAAFVAMARTLDVNQLLRRPPGAATGIVVSADGFVLTSGFNVADDTAFVAKTGMRPRAFAAGEPLEKLLAEPEGGLAQRPNAVRRVQVVLADGSRRDARVHARHEPLGIALLKIDADGLRWLDLAGTATSPQLGDQVAAVGRMDGGSGSITLNPGIVGAASRHRGQTFQTDALINYGNSGGPVVDTAGNLLGIATAPLEPDAVMGRVFPLTQLLRFSRAPNSGVGFVARADRIRAVLDDLKAGRSFDRIPGPFLGVQADEARALGEDVVIGAVIAGSPAAAAGLRKGDVVVACDGVELAAWRELTERVAGARPGDAVVLTIRRRQKGPRLVIAGRDVETLEDLERLKKSLRPGDTFEGLLTTDDLRDVRVILGETR